MKITQPDPDNDTEGPSLPETEPDPGDGERTFRMSPIETTGETGEISSPLATSRGGAGGEDDPSTPRSMDKPLSPERSFHEDDTERPPPGNTTVDSPPIRGRDSTFPYLPDPDALDTESALPPGPEHPDKTPPNVAGYEILEVLGEGGMGIVFKARHVRLDRFVALKMIRAGTGARSQDLARFEAEARAVAAIEHPNIIRIFEIGEYSGMPYCSLEYLSGGSLARQIGGKPQPVSEAARIVSALATGMEVAHKRGIVHRDLKPGNVLIAADGTLKVTDFGLVKRLEEDSSQTRTGAIMGTASYMSPEQAKGETHNIGPAADQYALGAILYELLTGRPPFHGTTVLDTLDQVCRKEPVPPSQLQTRIPRDIETICLKCLEKDSARRYTDVTALAEDLRRYQAGEPIVARPISRPERVWRWCLRNRMVAGSVATALLILLIAAVGGTAAAVVISRQKQTLSEAIVALANANIRAENRRQEAEAKRKLAEKAAWAANKQNRSAVEAEIALLDLVEGKLQYVPELEDVRKEVLDRTIARLEEAAAAMIGLRNEIGWDPEDEENNWKSLARSYQRLAELSLSSNRTKDAFEQLRRLSALVEARSKDNPADLMRQYRLAKSRRQLGHVTMNELGDAATAQRYLREALAIDRSCLAKEPANETFKYGLANSLGQLGISEKELGHLEEARQIFDEEAQIRSSFTKEFARNVEIRRELASMYEQVADLKYRMNEPAEGERLFQVSTKIRQEVLAGQPGFWPHVRDIVLAYNNAGFTRYPQGRQPAAAREFHRKALELVEERAAVDPANAETQTLLATTLYYDATCALQSGDRAGAELEYRRCLEIRKALAKEPHAKLLQVELMLALARCGLHAEAAKIAHALTAIPPQNEQLYFQSACGYALAAGCVAGEKALARQYTSSAIACLRKGKQAGWNDRQTLEFDPDLEPIRKDPEFRALLEEFKRPDRERP